MYTKGDGGHLPTGAILQVTVWQGYYNLVRPSRTEHAGRDRFTDAYKNWKLMTPTLSK